MEYLKVIGAYMNGGTLVTLFNDGTKIRYEADYGGPEFPESIDLCVTHKCDGGCPFCYDSANKEGKHARLVKTYRNGKKVFAQPWMNGLRQFTELALNANDLSHPELEDFLKICHERDIVCNVTVNIRHFMTRWPKILDWQRQGLVKGIGISVSEKRLMFKESEELKDVLKYFKNIVFHVICGTEVSVDITYLSSLCRGVSAAVLFLGYKNIGRGKTYSQALDSRIEDRINQLRIRIPHIIKSMEHNMLDFKAVSFDCLAFEQLTLKNVAGPGTSLEECYMGDDGTFTMYVDAVEQTFSKSSTDIGNKFDIDTRSIEDMFKIVQELKRKSF